MEGGEEESVGGVPGGESVEGDGTVAAAASLLKRKREMSLGAPRNIEEVEAALAAQESAAGLLQAAATPPPGEEGEEIGGEE